MHLKYKVMFHDQNGQHSYVDLVMCSAIFLKKKVSGTHRVTQNTVGGSFFRFFTKSNESLAVTR
jgi:hypothetical protein